MRIVAICLWVFFGTAVPFGLLIGLTDGDTGSGLWQGAGFGIFMTAAIGILLLLLARKIPVSREPRQESTFLVTADAEAVRQRAVEALSPLAVSEVTAAGQRVEARTKRHRGYRVSVELRPAGGGASTEVTVRSEPALRTVLVDNGDSRRIVGRVAEALSAAAPA